MIKESALINSFLDKNSSFRRYVFNNLGKYLTFVFLCGKKLEPNDNRSFIKDNIVNAEGKISILSEDLYSLFKDSNLDLLTIEEILLDISTAVILIIESYGSACELGAFSFSNNTVNKLWVINDNKHKSPDSFIESGPLSKIKKYRPDQVFYLNFKADNNIDFDSRTVDALSKIEKRTFSAKTVRRENDILVISDLSFLICFLFDFAKTFGIIFKEQVYDLVKNYIDTSSNKYKAINIRFQSGNIFDDQPLVKSIIEQMIDLLVGINLLQKKNNRKTEYYIMNYDFIKKLGFDISSFDSLLFQSSFFNGSRINEIDKLKNKLIKSGFELW